MKKTILTLVTIIILSMPAYALEGQAGQEIDVLKAGVGARALGMGGAFVAIADGADAPYWNPAGLAQVDLHEITTMQTKLSTDADHYYISYVQPFMGGAFGVSWIQVGLGDIALTEAATNEYNEVVTRGIFSYFSNAYMLSYGRYLTNNISFGLTAKYLQASMQDISSGEAYGYSLTAGILYKPSKNLSIGLKVDELVNSQKWGTGTEEQVPAKWRLGLAYLLPLTSSHILISGDISQVAKEGYLAESCAGAEWKMDGLSLRVGYLNDAMTAGAGFKTGHAEVNYAYITQTELSRENVHRISLTGRW
jgi:hypothetical protein